MDQQRTFAIVLNSAGVYFFLRFSLTVFKISAFREEERNNRVTDKAKNKRNIFIGR